MRGKTDLSFYLMSACRRVHSLLSFLDEVDFIWRDTFLLSVLNKRERSLEIAIGPARLKHV